MAVVPVQGTISPRMSVLAESSGGVSLDRLTQTFRQAVNDPQVDSVVLDIHSPGGSVYGVQEFADEVFRARTVKPILAVANAEAASAAYWIGSAANEFSVIPSGLVGSIGVIAVHDDWSKAMETAGVKSTYIISSKFKAEGNPDEPLTDEGRAAMQKLVDDYDAKFTKAVARNRAVSVATVRKDFGEGRVMTSEDALRAGMVDRIGTFDQAVIRAGSGKVSVAAAQPLDDGWIQMRRHRLEVLGY